MTVDDVTACLSQHQADLAAFHVASLRVFGSVARGTARPDSDVDLLVTFSAPIGLFRYARLQRLLADWLGRPVDLVTEDGLKPQLQGEVLGEAIRAA